MKRYIRAPLTLVCPAPGNLSVFTPRSNVTLHGTHLDTLHRVFAPSLQTPQSVREVASATQTSNLQLVERYVEVMQRAGAIWVIEEDASIHAGLTHSAVTHAHNTPVTSEANDRILFSTYPDAPSILLRLTQQVTPGPHILVLTETPHTRPHTEWFRGILGTLPAKISLLRVYDLNLADCQISLRGELDISDPDERQALPYRLGLVSPLPRVDQIPLAWIGPGSRVLETSRPVFGLRRDEQMVTLWLANALVPYLPVPDTCRYSLADNALPASSTDHLGPIRIALSEIALRAALVVDTALSLGSTAITSTRQNLLTVDGTPASSDLSWLLDVLRMKVSEIWASVAVHDSALVVITTEYGTHRSLIFESAQRDALLQVCAALYYPELPSSDALAVPFEAEDSQTALKSALSRAEAWIVTRAPEASLLFAPATVWGRQFWHGRSLAC